MKDIEKEEVYGPALTIQLKIEIIYAGKQYIMQAKLTYMAKNSCALERT